MQRGLVYSAGLAASRNTSVCHFLCHMATAAVNISERIAVLDGLVA